MQLRSVVFDLSHKIGCEVVPLTVIKYAAAFTGVKLMTSRSRGDDSQLHSPSPGEDLPRSPRYRHGNKLRGMREGII